MHLQLRNLAMLPIRSGRAIQRTIHSPTPWSGRHAAAGSRTLSRLHGARPTGCVQCPPLSQSRVPTIHLSPLARQKSTLDPAGLRTHYARARTPISPNHLKSAFPTKTVLFLLVVGGFLYYFVDVEDEEDWQHGCFNSYQEDQSHGTPLHFYRDKEELDHYLQFHVLDPSASLKDPGVAQFLSEQFDKLAYGWMMTEEVIRSMAFMSLPKTDSFQDAQKDNMPVTHGCRFRSNEPCEDFFTIGTSPGPGASPWNYWSIMDGHAGRQCSNYLQWTLIPFVSSALLNLPANSPSPVVENTIKETFLRIDK